MDFEGSATAETVNTPHPVGYIISVSGSTATVLLNDMEQADRMSVPTVGALMMVDTGESLSLCVVSEMHVPTTSLENNSRKTWLMQVEFSGELLREKDGYLQTFKRGVSISPRLGDAISIASPEILQKAYQYGKFDAVPIGVVHQNPSIPAVIKVEEMLSKHFAIVGSTGSGKSCTVALILQRLITKHPNAHIVLLDPHNEYGECFDTRSEIVSMNDLGLPFWIMTFEEIVEIFLGDRNKYSQEIELLREMIPEAKRRANTTSDATQSVLLQKKVSSGAQYSVDSPIPYRIADILSLLNDQMGLLDNKNDLAPFKRLKARLEAVSSDPRYHFMFGKASIQDNLSTVIRRIFRIPVAGKPITVLQLMGIPSEVLNVLVSVLARLTFDVAQWSEGKVPITLVCEEAHRYVPKNEQAGFEPTKRSISRIAKEGRKYGASIGIVSQRPGDLDPVILSQCSTIFAMRLSNESDQQIIGTALSDASKSLLNCMPMLGARETIVFGEGVPLSSRIVLDEVAEDSLPARNRARFATAWAEDIDDSQLLSRMIKRWRRTSAALGDIEQPSADVALQPSVPSETEDLAYQAEMSSYAQPRIYSTRPAPALEPQGPVGSGPSPRRSFGRSQFGK